MEPDPFSESQPSLREVLAMADHARSRTFSSDPAYHAEWGDLESRVRDHYLDTQDHRVSIIYSWLRAKASELQQYAAQCQNPVSSNQYRWQAQGIEAVATLSVQEPQEEVLAAKVQRLEEELELALGVAAAATDFTGKLHDAIKEFRTATGWTLPS